MDEIVSIENIATLIYYTRGQKIMLDRDLAELYQVETRDLKQAVRRNARRSLMIFDNAELRKEIEELRSETEDKFQIVFQALDQLPAQ
jgi:hypothetical protein